MRYDVPNPSAPAETIPLVVLDSMPRAADMFFMCLDSSLIPSVREDDDSEDEGPERPLEDPVLRGATDDVFTFLGSTFWSAYDGLQACRAALALAKRGRNILQCFIFYGAGGCGHFCRRPHRCQPDPLNRLCLFFYTGESLKS